MEEKRYTFNIQKTTDTLPDGRILVYFDEKVVKEKDYDEEGKEIGEHDAYAYLRVTVDAPLGKGEIVNAIIRERYSQDAVEAIFRHRFDGETEEFEAFDAYAEWAKVEAIRILS